MCLSWSTFFGVHHRTAPMLPCQKLRGQQKLKEHEEFEDENTRMHVLEDDKHARNVKNKNRFLQFEMIACLPPYLAHYAGPKRLGDMIVSPNFYLKSKN